MLYGGELVTVIPGVGGVGFGCEVAIGVVAVGVAVGEGEGVWSSTRSFAVLRMTWFAVAHFA